MSKVILSKTEKNDKFKLASIAGYTVKEFDRESKSPRCYIVGADNYINNDFKNIDEVLKYISPDLMSKGFILAA
mgnify:CR=1 FL=1